MKVQWRDNPEDATWETEDKIRASYPFLFDRMFLTPFSKVFFRTCFFHSSVSYRSNLRPLGRESMDANMCLNMLCLMDASGCKFLLVVACGRMYTHIRH